MVQVWMTPSEQQWPSRHESSGPEESLKFALTRLILREYHMYNLRELGSYILGISQEPRASPDN